MILFLIFDAASRKQKSHADIICVFIEPSPTLGDYNGRLPVIFS